MGVPARAPVQAPTFPIAAPHQAAFPNFLIKDAGMKLANVMSEHRSVLLLPGKSESVQTKETGRVRRCVQVWAELPQVRLRLPG